MVAVCGAVDTRSSSLRAARKRLPFRQKIWAEGLSCDAGPRRSFFRNRRVHKSDELSYERSFGSRHAGVMNMALCDGSVRSWPYGVTGLTNVVGRNDGKAKASVGHQSIQTTQNESS